MCGKTVFRFTGKDYPPTAENAECALPKNFVRGDHSTAGILMKTGRESA